MPPPPRILVVDDEPASRQALAELLTDEGYRVDTAGDGRAALSRLDQAPVDVLVTDLQIPSMGGLELVRRARAQGSRARMIVISAYEPAASRLVAAPVEFVLKPIDLALLLRLLAAS